MFRPLVIGMLAVSVVAAAHAEILQGIHPLDALGDIQRKFPNATLLPVKAAWVKEDQAFYSLEGVGLPGKMRLAFDDSRPGWRKTHSSLAQKNADGLELSEADRTMMEIADRQSQQDASTALTINWVRWIPEVPIPLDRYKSKYGKPDKCGFSDSDLSPFCEWHSKALTATLTDDQKAVIQVETGFSREEYRSAYMAKYKWVPDWLEESRPLPSGSGQQSKGKVGARK